MNENLVSIIIPVYNTQNFLERCIESVLCQSYQNIEILILDDGSTDSSGAVCDTLAEKDNRIRVFHKKNSGVSDTRNVGLSEAKGEYITFIDSDDWVSKFHIENLVSALKETDAQMSTCRFLVTSGENIDAVSLDRNVEIVTDDKFYNALVESSYSGYVWNKLFVADVIRKSELKFNTGIYVGEDLLFVIEYLTNIEKVADTKLKSYFYYIHPGGVTSAKGVNDRLVSVLTSREKVLEIIKKVSLENADIVRSAYLSHLSKILYASYPYRKGKHKALYASVKEKLKLNSKGILKFKKVSLKSRIKLWIMVKFPRLVGAIYRKVKVD